jgi:Flp pilus assembly protein TadG
MKPMTTILLRMRRSALELLGNKSGLAAVEFAMIIPIMAMLFVGTNEFSAGYAIYRKVTLMARTLSDLTSQNTSVTDDQLTNFFNASKAIMTPYESTPVKATITELYIDPDTKQARVLWSKGAYPLDKGKIISVPAALAVGDTYLIFSQVKYQYVPSVAWFINKTEGIELSDSTFTRPRQSLCVLHPAPAAGAAMPPCPKT